MKQTSTSPPFIQKIPKTRMPCWWYQLSLYGFCTLELATGLLSWRAWPPGISTHCIQLWGDIDLGPCTGIWSQAQGMPYMGGFVYVDGRDG